MKTNINCCVCICVLLIALGTCFPTVCSANPSGINSSGIRFEPIQPVKNEDVIMSEEFVRINFDTKKFDPFITWPMAMGHGIYTLENTSDKNLELDIFFPVSRRPEHLSKEFKENFTVRIGNKDIPFKIESDENSKYRSYLLWKVAFKAREKVVMDVHFPIFPKFISEDNTQYYTTYFKYFTHTGSYWKKPIGKARFEYCDDHLVEVLKGKDVLEYACTKATRIYKITPEPYTIDRKRSCIVWERKNWTPKEGVDDLSVIKTLKFHLMFVNEDVNTQYYPTFSYDDLTPLPELWLLMYRGDKFYDKKYGHKKPMFTWKNPESDLETCYREFINKSPNLAQAYGLDISKSLSPSGFFTNKWPAWEKLPRCAIEKYRYDMYFFLLGKPGLQENTRKKYIRILRELLPVVFPGSEEFKSMLESKIKHSSGK